MESELESMRQYFNGGNTRDASWRESQLKGLLLFMREKEAEIFKALKEDLGKHPVEAFRDEVYFFAKRTCNIWNFLVIFESSNNVNLEIFFFFCCRLVL